MTVVYAERGGLITTIFVEPGDTVTAGQPLLVVEDSATQLAAEEAKLTYSSAKISLAAARISQRQAKAILGRQSELNRRGVVASHHLEDAETAFLMASNSVEQAEAAVAKARLAVQVAEDRVSDLTVRAPIAGTVTRLSAHVGGAVLDRTDAIHDGVGLLTIARLDSLAIDADVAEKAIIGLETNLEGEAVLDAFPDRPFTFALLRVAPEVNAAKGTVRLRLTPIDPPPGIRPGMAVRVRIALPPPNSQSTNHQGANLQ
ncbi:efflux transporter, RND family, MFP subunit [Candidatus Rhodobacter oscarellae]|uniref:Efflux transporter, RND family, MFP subunit n=2 Tax=Candidatus Rhodobacter oscarellae TaxID=1675527 RepID=A0A0J9E3Z0_9RHOB|nr:efflux transporter, RND family, MFP subunit [Candidatus Rhodobacter lobularis]